MLGDNALATSGTYRQNQQMGESPANHLIDPRTGYPVKHNTISVSVRHERAFLADAWATALAVLGSEEGLLLAEQLGLAALFIDAAKTPTLHNTSHW